MQQLPVWIQVLLILMVPLNGVLLTHILLTFRERKKERKENEQKRLDQQEKTADANAKIQVAEMDAQDKFVAQLLVRVRDLEMWQVERAKDAELRTEKMATLEIQNIVLEQRLEAMKYELAGKIGTAMGAIEKRVATALIDREDKEETPV